MPSPSVTAGCGGGGGTSLDELKQLVAAMGRQFGDVLEGLKGFGTRLGELEARAAAAEQRGASGASTDDDGARDERSASSSDSPQLVLGDSGLSF